MPVDIRQIAIALRPKRDDLVGRPDGHRAGDRPERIIQHLIAE